MIIYKPVSKKTRAIQIHDWFPSGECYIMLIVYIDIPRVIRNGLHTSRTSFRRRLIWPVESLEVERVAQWYLGCYADQYEQCSHNDDEEVDA
jgi:hypothetical protein